ncbi:hypothetical protein F5884DRAFT_716358 [Xylogone sp. PMI_703]|nr:hypothetical protein F5884DRAFT_716358 [Xylogone sp. PMI_703]
MFSTRGPDALKRYDFFNPKLRQDADRNGDIYYPQKLDEERQEWELTGRNTQYLTHIKSVSKAWPHLRYLADFMEVGTTVARWPTLKKDSDQRLQRFIKTKVTRIDYYKSGYIWSKEYTSPETLREGIKGEHQSTKEDDSRQLMLFIVEDLSREVIEILGSHFDIDPSFFREHIVDYAWYNIRDRWINHPALNVVTRRQRWLQLRFVRPRYFKTKESFKDGFKQAEEFNVNRRPDDDQNINSLWDDNNAVVGLTRSRASFWMKSEAKNKGSKSKDEKKQGDERGPERIMLVDPTIEAGSPLWYGYRNWEPTPSVSSTDAPPDPPRKSLYEDLIFWAKRPQGFRFSPSDTEPANVHLPVHALLHLVSAEWLIICDYIKCRLGQIEWGISAMGHTAWIYVIVAVPLAIISLIIARMLTYPKVHKFVKNLFTFGVA